MKEKKIVFLILHYILENETIRCVKSIEENIDTKNYEIVIVDNCSPNNSYEILKEKYKNDKKVHLLRTDKNLGFTGGNNIGFKYSKKLNADFICMMNNDTYLIQNNFFKVIYDEYLNSKFGVMGPEIHLPNGNIEKVQLSPISEKKLKLNRFKLEVLLLSSYIGLDNLILKIEKKLKKNKKITFRINIKERVENVVLHGCCLIFSPKYIKLFDGIDQKTFLYGEEEFLYLKLKKNNLLSIYNPNLKIFHNEQQSTKSQNKKRKKNIQFRYKYLIKANKVLLKEMKSLKK